MVVEHHATHLLGNFEGLKMTVAILKTKESCKHVLCSLPFLAVSLDMVAPSLVIKCQISAVMKCMIQYSLAAVTEILASMFNCSKQ